MLDIKCKRNFSKCHHVSAKSHSEVLHDFLGSDEDGLGCGLAVIRLTKMPNDFSTEYAERSDDDLLQLASDRASLTNEAIAALNAEMSRRNITQSDHAKYQRFVKRNDQREAKRLRRKVFGTPTDRSSWFELLWAIPAMSLIAIAYLAVPSRYHLNPDWEDAVVIVMFASVGIAVAGNHLWRKIAFWLSLLLSSAVHLVVVHSWIRRVGDLGRREGKLAILLGFVLFLAVYGSARLLRRNFYGDETPDNA